MIFHRHMFNPIPVQAKTGICERCLLKKHVLNDFIY